MCSSWLNQMPRSTDFFVEAARSLQLDVVAGEVSDAFADAGIRCVVLRGPSVRRWLYRDSERRHYLDVDLLVAPERFAAAEGVLADLGFTYLPLMMERPVDRPAHERTWYREADSATIDLHRTIVGAGVSADEVWTALSGATQPLRLAGRQLAGLNAEATAFVVALHAAQHGSGAPRSLGDLRLAVERFAYELWEAAALLAARLQAAEALAVGLRLVPAGERLAADLGLPTSVAAATLLRSTTPPETALGFAWLTELPAARAKARFLWGTLIPDRSFVRGTSRLAGGGTLGLLCAYLWRWAWLLYRAPRGWLAWRAARRDGW